jgi:hypothetical protein
MTALFDGASTNLLHPANYSAMYLICFIAKTGSPGNELRVLGRPARADSLAEIPVAAGALMRTA